MAKFSCKKERKEVRTKMTKTEIISQMCDLVAQIEVEKANLDNMGKELQQLAEAVGGLK